MAFVDVCGVEELREGHGFGVVVEGAWVCLVREGAEVFALEDRCSHAQVALCGGEVVAGKIVCPKHLAEFDVRTGAALSMPAVNPVRTYGVRVLGGRVEVDVGGEVES